jgi:pyrimidine deaminase RibD-like protein
MNEKEINNLVRDFLAGQSPRFSEGWKADIVSRLKNPKSGAKALARSPNAGRSKELRRVLRTECELIHEQKLKWLRTQCESFLRRKYGLDHDLTNSIASDALVKWLYTFQPKKGKGSKNPELYWLRLLANQAAFDHVNGRDWKHKSLDSEEAVGSYDDPTAPRPLADIIADPKAQQPLEDIILERQGYELEEEYQTVDFKLINPRDGSPLHAGKKRVAYVASREIFRHYLLTKRARPPKTDDELPPLIGSSQRSFTDFINFYRGHNLDLSLSLLDTGSVTGYFKLRHHVLCNADARRWMELALSKLRESAEKARQGLFKAGLGSKTKESRGQSPASIGVAVCTSGKGHIWFNGGFDEATLLDGKGRSVPRKSHCEDCPALDLQEDELPTLKGGTLYLTHEPCGRRWSPGEGRNGEARIPCEVRFVEGGFSHYYIGSLNHNKSARGNGIEVLRTGAYVFKLKRGEHADEEAVAGSASLEKYFREKGYPLVEETEECRKYKIGGSAEVSFFDTDLMFEIYNLNAALQR